MRLRSWLALGLSCAAALPAAAAAAPTISGPTPARFLGTTETEDGYATDLDRYVAVGRAGAAYVYDMLRGSGYLIRDCARPHSDGSGGHFLLWCPDRGYRILNARARSLEPLPGTRPEDNLFDFGARWVFGDTCPPDASKCGSSVFLNWHTGERRECDVYSDEWCSSELLDLNSRDLAPIPRLPRLAVGVEPPFVLKLVLAGPTVFERHGRLVLIGQGRTRVLDHGRFCRESDCSPMLNAGRISWTRQDWGKPTSLLIGASARAPGRATWRIRDGFKFGADDLPSGPRIEQIHTRWGLVVAVNSKLDKPVGRGDRPEPLAYRLYVLRWPRRLAASQ